MLEEGKNIRVGDAIIADIMRNARRETYETLAQYFEVALRPAPTAVLTLPPLPATLG
jgi:hypothetical protein